MIKIQKLIILKALFSLGLTLQMYGRDFVTVLNINPTIHSRELDPETYNPVRMSLELTNPERALEAVAKIAMQTCKEDSKYYQLPSDAEKRSDFVVLIATVSTGTGSELNRHFYVYTLPLKRPYFDQETRKAEFIFKLLISKSKPSMKLLFELGIVYDKARQQKNVLNVHRELFPRSQVGVISLMSIPIVTEQRLYDSLQTEQWFNHISDEELLRQIETKMIPRMPVCKKKERSGVEHLARELTLQHLESTGRELLNASRQIKEHCLGIDDVEWKLKPFEDKEDPVKASPAMVDSLSKKIDETTIAQHKYSIAFAFFNKDLVPQIINQELKKREHSALIKSLEAKSLLLNDDVLKAHLRRTTLQSIFGPVMIIITDNSGTGQAEICIHSNVPERAIKPTATDFKFMKVLLSVSEKLKDKTIIKSPEPAAACQASKAEAIKREKPVKTSPKAPEKSLEELISELNKEVDDKSAIILSVEDTLRNRMFGEFEKSKSEIEAREQEEMARKKDAEEKAAANALRETKKAEEVLARKRRQEEIIIICRAQKTALDEALAELKLTAGPLKEQVEKIFKVLESIEKTPKNTKKTLGLLEALWIEYRALNPEALIIRLSEIKEKAAERKKQKELRPEKPQRTATTEKDTQRKPDPDFPPLKDIFAQTEVLAICAKMPEGTSSLTSSSGETTALEAVEPAEKPTVYEPQPESAPLLSVQAVPVPRISQTGCYEMSYEVWCKFLGIQSIDDLARYFHQTVWQYISSQPSLIIKNANAPIFAVMITCADGSFRYFVKYFYPGLYGSTGNQTLLFYEAEPVWDCSIEDAVMRMISERFGQHGIHY